jgi:carnitine O-palmitoyltransferase 2
MFANQAALPQLPLPSLKESLARYLNAAAALVSPTQLDETRAIIEEALLPGSTLHRLQRQLEDVDAAAVDGSYVSTAWDAMYLKGRWPVAINCNPGAVSRASHFGDEATTQVQRAARIVAAAVIFSERVRSGTLNPDVFRGVPLDMRQYPRMFSSTRKPVAAGPDVLHRAAPGHSQHIVILRGACFWEVPIFEPTTGQPLSVSALEKALQAVVDGSPPTAADAPPSLAVLTTADRDTWAGARAELAAHSATNVASLESIDNARFVLCLDEAAVGCTDGGDADEGAQLELAVRLSLCGDARHAPRWFDKAAYWMLSADGVPMFGFEHSWGDGICVVRCGAEMYGEIGSAVAAAPPPTPETPPPSRLLEWDLPPTVAATRDECAEKFAQICAALDIGALHWDEWGTAHLKALGVPPDGTVQAAMQLAFFRTTGHAGSTYEACSTASFRAGRTETIRSCTSESAAWVRAAVAGGESDAALGRLLRESARRHSTISREAAKGYGFDRHLFALRALAESAGEDEPTLFADPTYAAVTCNELSTSTLTLWSTHLSGFGPVHPEGFGVSYSMFEDELRFCTTTYKPNSAAQFNNELRTALGLVARALEATRGEASRAAQSRL